jgi:hypothetical protein
MILEAAALQPGDEVNDEWVWLLDQLGLSTDYFLAVLETLRQGRWRAAKNPKSYVRTVAKREAQKMGLLREPEDILELVPFTTPHDEGFVSVEEKLEYLASLNEEDYDDDDELERNDRPSFSDVIANGLADLEEPSSDLVATVDKINGSTDEFHIPLNPRWRANWDKWAKEAGFDVWDCAVLRYRLAKVSRDCAMSEQPDVEARKAIQAAWRRFDRTGVQRLRSVIQKVNTKNVPETRV